MKEYREYLKNIRKNTPDTIKGELSALRRFPDFASPDELIPLKRTREQSRGLRKFLQYLDDVKGMEYPLGTRTDRWLKLIKIEQAVARQKEAADQDILEAYTQVLPEYRTFYKLKCLSGARTEHLYEMIREYDPSKVIVEGQIARYPTAHLAKGTKGTYYIFFPAYLLPEIEWYKFPTGKNQPA